jgi:hypothetical protein
LAPVRDDCKTMSPSESRNGREVKPTPEGGILAALPRARPQRASARRAAARTGAGNGRANAQTKTSAVTRTKPARARATAKPASGSESAAGERSTTDTKPAAATKPAIDTKPAATKKSAATKKPTRTRKPVEAKRRVPKPIAKPIEPPAPKQGYEPEEEVELGATVHPPSGAELVESVADIVGELAGSSLAAGGRLLKDAFSLLRRP